MKLKTTQVELLEMDLDTDTQVSRLAHDAAVAHVLARKLAEMQRQLDEMAARMRPRRMAG
jgi:hypothetical protein